MDLFVELEQKRQMLDKSIKELRNSGANLGQCEKEYKIQLRNECLKLRNEGMPIGMIDKTCYGVPIIAELRFKRDVAETIYKANLEAINSIKLEIRIIQNQIDKEYGNA
jgi:hypothetical protein